MTLSKILSSRPRAVAALSIALCLAVPGARAQAPAQNSEAARKTEFNAALQAGIKAGTRGPASVTLLDQAGLAVPAGYLFIPAAEGKRILRALGNTVSGDNYQGIVIGTSRADNWIVVVRYIKDGYIKDDDAKNWNADELLQNLKEGNEQANRDRASRGFPEVEIIGWIEKPTYDAATHRLVWSLLSKDKDEPDSADKGVNYNTYALGRDGYFSLNLLTAASRVETDKAVARTLLGGLDYNPGRRYEDFNASTDHIAAYGIAALVGGVVAKKLGLFALGAAFVIKFAKVILIAVAAFFGGIFKLFGRKKTQA